MGYNIENEKLLRSEDENVGEVEHLLKEMAKEDGKKTTTQQNMGTASLRFGSLLMTTLRLPKT
jgi:hypothetical protein